MKVDRFLQHFYFTSVGPGAPRSRNVTQDEAPPVVSVGSNSSSSSLFLHFSSLLKHLPFPHSVYEFLNFRTPVYSTLSLPVSPFLLLTLVVCLSSF